MLAASTLVAICYSYYTCVEDTLTAANISNSKSVSCLASSSGSISVSFSSICPSCLGSAVGIESCVLLRSICNSPLTDVGRSLTSPASSPTLLSEPRIVEPEPYFCSTFGISGFGVLENAGSDRWTFFPGAF